MNTPPNQDATPTEPCIVPWDLQVMVFIPDREAAPCRTRIVSFVSTLGPPQSQALDWALQEAAQLPDPNPLTEGRLARAQVLGRQGDFEAALLLLGVLLSGQFKSTLVWPAPQTSTVKGVPVP